MDRPLRQFVSALAAVWICLALAGALYSRRLAIPPDLAAPIIAAFLWEASFYIAPGFTVLRRAAALRWSPPVFAAGLTASAAAPLLVYALPTGLFDWRAAVLLLSLAAVASFWFVVLPPSRATDFAFVAFMAAPILFRLFQDLYPSPAAGVPLAILGQLMWIRLGVWVILCIRQVEETGFGFWPSRDEWLCGVRFFVLFLPVGVPLALALGVVRFQPVPWPWWQALAYGAATFFGMLWVVALSEEFFFRGLLQPWLSRLFANRWAGLALTSVLFGLVHLPFRGFPNWRFASVAAVAGLFYGLARDRSRGIRASMAAHALVNTLMRLLFS